jgi:hypothetical protein
VRCCSHWVYQQQGWWCGAVATGFISSKDGGAVLWPLGLSGAGLVVRCCSHWVYQEQGWWCCVSGHWVYQQQDWWCCAVANVFIRRRLVVRSNCIYARSAPPSYINTTSTMVCGSAMNLHFFSMARQPSWV